MGVFLERLGMVSVEQFFYIQAGVVWSAGVFFGMIV